MLFHGCALRFEAADKDENFDKAIKKVKKGEEKQESKKQESKKNGWW